MIKQIFSFVSDLWTGFESKAEQQKFALLSGLFGLAIGIYWTLRPIKDTLFMTIVGRSFLPKAKILSVFVIIPLIFVYEKLVDMFPRHKLLYGICSFYAFLTLIFAALILHPTMGISNTVASESRYLGWLFYFFVESFGSIVIALFWSFVSDTTTPESAKRGYPLVNFGGQVGGVAGPACGLVLIHALSVGWCVVGCAFALISLVFATVYFMKVAPKDQMKGFGGDVKAPIEGTSKPKVGFLDGLTILVTKPYMLGILVVVSFYEIIATILDYQFKSLAKEVYVTSDSLGIFLEIFAISVNLLALVCVIFGAGKLGKKIGLAKSLLLLPIAMAIAVVLMRFNPSLAIAFGIMVVAKGLNYALNAPAKEQLYIPTSKDAKYKGKAWIDMFGSRSSKALGSVINDMETMVAFFKSNPSMFALFTMCISLGLIGVWLFAAMFIGKTHAQAIKENKLVC